MNADIVYKLCPYLDVGSLLALAAAYPTWSPMVRKYMEKKRPYIELTLDCEANVETLKYEEYLRGESDVLPKPVWNEVTSRVLDIYSVTITQKDGSTISEDAYALLMKIRTYFLEISFHSRSEARRVLRTITLRPRSDVTLFESSRGPDRESILVQSELARFKRIEYYGYTDMLHNDLLDALDTEMAIVRYAGAARCPQSLRFAGFIEGHLAAKGKQVHCVRRGPAEYEIERIPRRGANRSSARPRTITAFSYVRPTKPFHRDDGVYLVIENYF